MDTFDRFISFIKEAAPEDVYLQVARAKQLNRPTPVNDLLKDTFRPDIFSDIGHVAYKPVKPFVDSLKDVIPFSSGDVPTTYTLGSAIGRMVKTPFYNPNDLGPYEQMVDYLKKTEEGEMLLREARKLRRKARIIQEKQEREEALKKHVESSRYF